MSFQFRTAQRSQAKPLIGLYAESGKGKTYTALLLARGFVGPEGRIGMIETEAGRGEAYADPTEYPEIGGYDVSSLRDDFSAKAYHGAIKAAEEAKFDALIIDSASHEWNGTGGVLDVAARKQADGVRGVLVWQEAKIDHKKYFMLSLTGCSIPLVIVCMRAKYPMEERVQNGRKDWVRSPDLEPVQADDILYEMFIHGFMDQQHNFHLTRCTAKALQPVFDTGKPLTLETGRQLALWAKGKPVSAAEERTTPAKIEIDTDRLFADARAAASRGNGSLDNFVLTLGRAHKEALKPIGGELRITAKTADDATSMQKAAEAAPVQVKSYTLVTATGTNTYADIHTYLDDYEATVKRLAQSGKQSEFPRFDRANKDEIDRHPELQQPVAHINKVIRPPARDGLDV